LLGLCPLLAVSTTFVNAVSLGLATILVMMLANFAISALRALIPYEIRIPVFILIIAALVTSSIWPSTPSSTTCTWCWEYSSR
jgi:electron transport complex protein RnfE